MFRDVMWLHGGNWSCAFRIYGPWKCLNIFGKKLKQCTENTKILETMILNPRSRIVESCITISKHFQTPPQSMSLHLNIYAE